MHQIFLLFLCLFSSCIRTSVGLVPIYCVRGEHRVIANEKQAILAARNAWYCIYPNEREATEQGWLNDFVAAREGASWRVRLPEGHVGPMIAVKVAAADGRVEDVQITR